MSVRILLAASVVVLNLQDPSSSLTQALNQLQDKEALQRQLAVDLLSSLPEPEATEALIRALDDEDRLVRFKAISALGARPESATNAIPVLKRLERIDPDVPIRREATRALAAIQDAAPKSTNWIAMLATGGALLAIVVGVGLYLRRVVQVNAVPDLIKQLKSRRVADRCHAAQSLGIIGEKAKPALPQLLQMLKDPDPTVKQAADEAMKKIGVAAHPGEPNLSVLKNPDEWARRRAVIIWGNVSVPSDLEINALIKALGDPADGVRMEASEALGRFGRQAESAVPHLRELHKDPAYSVRQAASQALNAIARR